jgi:hypothetical protein
MTNDQMAADHHDSPASVPEARRFQAKNEKRRRAREQVDRMLSAYWAALIADAQPLAEPLLERALKETALGGTLFV